MRHKASKGDIQWQRKRSRPIRGWEPGHSPMQYGRKVGRYGRDRTYILCECGTVYSGNGDSGGPASHRRHINRLKFVHVHEEGKPCVTPAKDGTNGCMPQAQFDALRKHTEGHNA